MKKIDSRESAMTVNELAEKIGLTFVATGNSEQKEVKGCYIGDLLSWVMGRAESMSAWITIMNNVNIVAVASLADVACIILAEGVTVADDVKEKANAQNVAILSSNKTAYELATEIYECI